MALVLALQSAPPATTPGVADDVVIYGAKLSRFRASVAFDADGAHCRVFASTGDAEIDRVGCHAIETCYPAHDASNAASRDRGKRKAALDRCFATTTRDGLTELAARRATRGN